MVHPPGPRGRAAFGFFGAGSLGGMLDFFRETARKYGAISSFRILHKRIYLIDDADIAQQILVTRQHEFVRDTGATLLRELVGDGLITREEPLHRERRRALQPAFHRDQIASYANAMVSECERVSTDWQGRESIDIRLEMRKLTLAIVGATLFGTEFRDSANRIADVLQRTTQKSTWLAPSMALIEPAVILYRKCFPSGRSLFFQRERRELDEIVEPIIRGRRGTKERDVLSLILNQQFDDGQPLSAKDVQNEVVTFVLAGHETTSTALTWTWYLLSQHPDAAERMHRELDEVLGGRAPTLEDVPRLSYTANVLKEALRLYPPAMAFGRRPKVTLELGGYRIRRGASIFLSPYVTQRNPHYFDRPDDFIPERWENIQIPKFAYFPFGGGAKMCIGEPFARLEGLLALATLGRRWSLETDASGEMKIGKSVLLTPEQNLSMRLKARSGALALS